MLAPPPPEVVVLLEPLMRPRFGSVQLKFEVGMTCGNASALISRTTPLVRWISSFARRRSGFCLIPVKMACSRVNLRAGRVPLISVTVLLRVLVLVEPVPVNPTSFEPAGAIGPETVPDSLGEIVGVGVGVGVGDAVGVRVGVGDAVGVGDGVGVDVETSVGVGVGEAVGVSVGLGLCPNEKSAIRNAPAANPPARNCFRITS